MSHSHETVSIEFMGKTYRVSGNTTLLGALLEIGWDSVRGKGCLGGCCGACAALYRLPGESHVRTGLACRTPVQDGISFSLIGQFPAPKPEYRLSDIADPKQTLFDLFPEVAGCRNCRSCIEACPQGLDVMRGVWHAVFGNFLEAADVFLGCVQCGLCARVCSAGLRPFLVGVYARRAQGALLTEQSAAIAERIRKIEDGAYEAEWEQALRGLAPPCPDESL
jgi:succinate dehydrogenase/fumarate reductase-like Fe-S protein